MKIIRDCQDLYVQSHPVLLACIFEDFKESVSELAWITPLKIIKVQFELITDIDFLLMVENKLEKEFVIHWLDMPKLKVNP